MPWPQTGATHYYAQLGLPDKGRAIKGLVVCNNWDLEPLDLLNGLALGCYQPSPEVLIVLWMVCLHVRPRRILYYVVCFYVWGVGVLELDSHPDHNNLRTLL